MGPAGKFTSNDTQNGSTDASRWCTPAGKTPAGPMKSIGIASYSADQKVHDYGTDSSGMTMTTVPRGTVQGDTWMHDDEGVLAGQKMKIRVTLKELSPTSTRSRWKSRGPDGKWAPLMESKNTKVK
jgi:hypothetical protein